MCVCVTVQTSEKPSGLEKICRRQLSDGPVCVSTEGQGPDWHHLEGHDFGEVQDYEVVRPIRLHSVRRVRQTQVAELLLLLLLLFWGESGREEVMTDDCCCAPPAGRPAADSSLCHDCGREGPGDAAGEEQVSLRVSPAEDDSR